MIFFIGRLPESATCAEQAIHPVEENPPAIKKSHIYTLSYFFVFLSINSLEKPGNSLAFSTVFPCFSGLSHRNSAGVEKSVIFIA
jgi:hypothetical protein